jgi:sporulation-control protein spo0M
MLKLQCRHQAITNNDKENQTCIPHAYKVGNKVLIVQRKYERKSKAKLSSPTEGPFTVTQVNMNGNVHIDRGTYEEDISIDCHRPYYDPE